MIAAQLSLFQVPDTPNTYRPLSARPRLQTSRYVVCSRTSCC